MATSPNPFDQFDAKPVANPFDQFDKPAPEPSTFAKVAANLISAPAKIKQTIMGAAEQPYAVLQSGAEAWASLAKTLISPSSETSGLNFSDRFEKEYSDIHRFVDSTPGLATTPAGQRIGNAIGSIFDTVGQAAGDFMYYATTQDVGKGKSGFTPSEDRQLAGLLATGTKTMIETAGMLLGGRAVLKGEDVVPKGPVAPENFESTYKATADVLNASQVGAGPIMAAKKTYPMASFGTIVDDAINKALGVTPEMLDMEPNLHNVTLADKMKTLVQQKAAEVGQIIPENDINTYVNHQVNKLMELQKYWDKMQADAAPKALPRPYALDDPIYVNTKGQAVTTPQWNEWIDQLTNATPENKATMMGIGPMGVARTHLVDYLNTQQAADLSGAAADIKTATKNLKQLTDHWNQVFDYPKSTAARSAALQEYIDREGNMSYNEALAKVGPRKGTGMNKQSGAFVPEVAYDSVKHLGDGVAKYAAAGLISASGFEGPKTMFRGTAPLADTSLKPGSWVSDSKETAHEYANKLTGKDTGGVVTEHTIPGEHLVKAHPGGYIYTPPGFNLGPINRFKHKDTGQLTTFAELLPNQPVGRTPLKGQVLDFNKAHMQRGMERIQTKLHEAVNTRTAAMMEKVNAYKGWKFDIGDRIKSRQSGRVYQVTYKYWDTKNDRPMYGYKDAAGEEGQFIATSTHDTFTRMTGPVGGKQGGAFVPEDIVKGAGKTLHSAEKAAEVGWSAQNPAADAQKVEAALRANEKALADSRKIGSSWSLKGARRATYMHDYDLRHDIASAGPAGVIAQQRMVVQNGSGMAAQIHIDKVNKRIYGDLNHTEHGLLDDIIYLRRVVQIDKYWGVGKVRHLKGITGPQADAALAKMSTDLGAQKFGRLQGKADAVFSEQRLLLRKLFNAGIIDKDLFVKLYNLDYSRRDYIEKIDPNIPVASHNKSITTSITSSGIAKLGHGAEEWVNTDSRLLLNEDIARVEGRIFRNKTLQAFRDVATQHPDNGIVSIPSKALVKTDEAGNQKMRHTPSGWTSIGVRVAGKQEFFLMKDSYAAQFVNRVDEAPAWLSSLVKIASLSPVLRASTTTYNPKFALASIPMDIVHIGLIQDHAYSSNILVYPFQFGKDMMETFSDVSKRTGEWEDAMREGLGPSYLTHEGRSLVDPSKSLQGQLTPKLAKTKKAIAYFNETAQIWMDIAYRHRLMKNGDASNGNKPMDSWQATAKARDRMDTAQGGFISKFVDKAIPWTNVTIQATGKVIEAAARDPVDMAFKVGQYMAVAAAFKWALMQGSPETDKAIPTDDKTRNLNIGFGDNWYVMDANGNKRYYYLPLRVDQTIMPINSAVVGGMELGTYGKAPSGLFLSAVGQVSPYSSALPIPSADAISTYFTNYDIFAGSAVYKGPKVSPENEVRSFGQGVATDPLFDTIGKLTGTSPMRLQAATGKVFSSGNTYLQGIQFMRKEVFNGADPRDQATAGAAMLQQIPFLGSILKLTPSRSDMFEDLVSGEQKAGDKKSAALRGLDDLMFQYEHKQNDVTAKTIETYIRNQAQPMPGLSPAENAVRASYGKYLTDHAMITVKVNTIMDRYNTGGEIPPKAWWTAAAKAPADVRAQQFFSKWISADTEDRQKMMSIAGSLQASGVGFWNDETQAFFLNEKKMMGDDRR